MSCIRGSATSGRRGLGGVLVSICVRACGNMQPDPPSHFRQTHLPGLSHLPPPPHPVWQHPFRANFYYRIGNYLIISYTFPKRPDLGGGEGGGDGLLVKITSISFSFKTQKGQFLAILHSTILSPEESIRTPSGPEITKI